MFPDTCTISLMKLKPPGPTTEPARRYPVITWKINTELVLELTEIILQ